MILIKGWNHEDYQLCFDGDEGIESKPDYKLIGNTVIGRVAVTIPVESNTDDTKLWHMRLGHIGEHSMLELHKKNLLKGVKTCKLDFCKYYVHGKQFRVSFKIDSHTSKGVLEYIHSNV